MRARSLPRWVLAAPAALLGCSAAPAPERVEPVYESAAGNTTEDLIATLGRAVDPRVTSISLTGELLYFRSMASMYGVPGIPMGDVPRETRIRFDNIREVVALDDANVTIELIGGRTERIRFATREDARRFAGLLLGMRGKEGDVP